jgi:HSP20 family protein
MTEQTRNIAPAGNGQRGLARREGRWDPSTLLDEFQQEMARFWNEPFGAWPVPRLWRRVAGPGRFMPRMDVYEKDNQLVVEAELPGLKREDVQVELEAGDLLIRGESRQEHEVREENYYRSERGFGSFYRRVPLGFEVDPNQIKASMNNGVLEVRVPKPAEARTTARRIEVK